MKMDLKDFALSQLTVIFALACFGLSSQAALEFNEAGQNNTANGVAAPEGGDEQQVYDESALATCVAPATGLVSWWPGDNSAEDLQGINPFTLENGATFAAGKVKKAFALDGIDDSLSAADNASLNPGTGDFTFEFWIRTTNSGVREAVLEKRPVCGCANLYSIKVNADGTIVSETLQDVNCTNFVTVTSTFPINDGVFHHVALTRQGVNVTLFIDGVQNATGSSPTTCNLSNTAPFIVGRTVCSFDRSFHGRIDELSYYTTALSPSAVQAIYTAGAAGKCKPPMFVQDINPSWVPSGNLKNVTNSTTIKYSNGGLVTDATVTVKVTDPSRTQTGYVSVTDVNGKATFSFLTQQSGTFVFKVTAVTKAARTYDATLNVETGTTLTIP